MNEKQKSILTDMLKRHEGYVKEAYKDRLGFWTIGYGRLIDGTKGGGITVEEAEYLLANDIKKHEAELIKRFPAYEGLDGPRQVVLLNMAFNLGISGLMAFKKMLDAVIKKDYQLAASEMLASKWSMQVGKRAKELAEIMRSPA